MLLQNIITRNELVEAFTRENNFADAACALLKEQRITWEQLREGYLSLSSAKIREFDFGVVKIDVQHNPARVKSTSAKVDAASINGRECFLCPENLPAGQKGILFENEMLILCNPYPIFPEHFTISSIEHKPQRISGSFNSMLSLTRSLGKYYFVFYNGPSCGASAPDHLHFQAGSKSLLPLVKDYSSIINKHGKKLTAGNGLELFSVDDGLRRFFAFESKHKEILEEKFKLMYDKLSKFFPAEDETLLNIISFYDEDTGWKVLVIPRFKHRPSFYFMEGEEQVLVSPAAVDIGGLIITPRRKDFDSITHEMVINIFNEVMLNSENFEEFASALEESIGR